MLLYNKFIAFIIIILEIIFNFYWCIQSKAQSVLQCKLYIDIQNN